VRAALAGEVGRKDEIPTQIAGGLASLRAGKGDDGDAVFDRLEAEIDTDERSQAK